MHPDSLQKLPIGGKLLIWNALLHLSVFFLNMADGQAGHFLGIGAEWFLTSVLLSMCLLLEKRSQHWILLSALLYLSGVFYNYFSDCHWHLFGSIFNFNRLTGMLDYPVKKAELSALLDGYVILHLMISTTAIIGPLLVFPERMANKYVRRHLRLSAAALLTVAGLFFFLSPSAREDTLWGLVGSSRSGSQTEVADFAQHVPLRLLLQEQKTTGNIILFLPEDRPKPNILFIDYESVGAMYFSYYEPTHGLEMKNFEELANHSIVGARHYSVNGGSSHGSDWSILTGLYPPNFGATPIQNDKWIPQKNFFSYFKRAGYYTGAFYGSSSKYREFYKLFKQPYCDVFRDKYSEDFKSRPDEETPDEKALHMMFKEMDRLDGKPFAFFYRTDNGHWPYISRRGKRSMPDLERYKLALLEGDQFLGEIISELKTRGIFKDTIIVIVGDHGEAFQQHENLRIHTVGVYEELVRVPFLIAYPRYISKSNVVPHPTSHTDILPTLLDMVDVSGDDLPEFEGYSLLRELPPNRTVFVSNGDDGSISGVIRGPYKLILKQTNREEMLFDLNQDPLETKNLIADFPDVAKELRTLEKKWEEHRRRGIGKSRYLDQESSETKTLLISGNVNVDVYLNGEKIASLEDVKKCVLPLSFRDGHNFLSVVGVQRYRGNYTGIRFRLQDGKSTIGTGAWWKVSTSQEFINSRQWLNPETNSKEWESPSVKSKGVSHYVDYWESDWIELDQETPFVLRLDYEIIDGHVATEEVKIRCYDQFKWYIDGGLYGSGKITEWRDSYTFSFPRLHLDAPEIIVEASGGEEMRALLISGSVAGNRIDSQSQRWECVTGLAMSEYLKRNEEKNSQWTPVQSLPDLRVIGDWPSGIQYLWGLSPDESKVLFRSRFR